MKAVVLVGGFGTRLRPLTLSTPKQMLPVVHRTMIERVVAHLGRHGIDTAVLALGYRPDAFTAAYPDGHCAGVELHYAIEPEPRDTAGAIRFAALDAGIDERFLVLNGDVLTDLDVTALIATHERNGAEGTLALHRVDDPSAFGVVPTDADGRVTAFIEKPPPGEAPTDLINAGTYVLEPSVLARIAPDRPVNVERVTFPAMVADGSLFAVDGDTYWIDAGTPSTYLAANLDLIAGLRGAAEEGVHPDAIVRGAVDGSVVGAGARVESGATVCGSLVLAGAVVRAGASVHDSIIGPRVTVEAGAVVQDGSVIGDDVVVAAGERVTGKRVPEEVA
ncbi:MAG: NDP-sugar synthase [Acidimicrobiales bacterium]